jgi:hypothetical protein
MLEQSRRLNPARRHLLGEMRSLRLGENSGAVLVFDAIGHMTTEADLLATPRTARAHPRARYGGLPPGLDGRLLRSRSLPGLNGRRGSSLGGTGS